MAFQRAYALLLVLTLMVPMVAVNFVPQNDDDVVCELLEDLSEEEEGDDKGETSFDEPFLRFHECNIAFLWEREAQSNRTFGRLMNLPSELSQEISTPPPEHTMS